MATAIGVKTVRPVDQTMQAAEAARRRITCAGDLWLQGLHDGTISIPGRADRELPDLAGACDVLGIVVADVDESLGAVLRAAEMGPDRPLSIALITPRARTPIGSPPCNASNWPAGRLPKAHRSNQWRSARRSTSRATTTGSSRSIAT